MVQHSGRPPNIPGYPRVHTLEPVYPRVPLADPGRSFSEDNELSTQSEVGPSGEESYRLSFNHSFSLPHRKPSGRVKRGMVEVQPKEPMTPPGEVAGISFAPQNDWSEPEELFRPYRRPRQMSGRHPVGLEGGGTILKGGVLGRSHRNQYTSKLPPIQVSSLPTRTSSLAPTLMAEGTSALPAVDIPGPAGRYQLDPPQLGAEFGSSDDSTQGGGKTSRNHLEAGPSQSQSPGHNSEHLLSKDVTIFPFAGVAHQIDEHSWRYRPSMELSTSLSNSVTDLEFTPGPRCVSLVEPNRVVEPAPRSSQVFPTHPNERVRKPSLSLYNRTSSFLSNGGSVDLSMSMTIDRVGALPEQTSSSNPHKSFHESSAAFAIANGPLWSSSERLVLVQETTSRR